MFGKRDQATGTERQAPPPAPTGGTAIATRPQRVDPAAPALAPAKPAAAPKPTAGLDQLRAAQGAVRVTLAAPQPGLAEALARAGVEVMESSDRHAVAMLAGGAQARSRLLAALVGEGFAVSDFTEDARNLEEVYFSRVTS